MSTVEPSDIVGPAASETAAAVAKQAVAVVHGDNDPAASEELRVRVAVVRSQVPPLELVDPDVPICRRQYRLPPSATGSPRHIQTVDGVGRVLVRYDEETADRDPLRVRTPMEQRAEADE